MSRVAVCKNPEEKNRPEYVSDGSGQRAYGEQKALLVPAADVTESGSKAPEEENNGSASEDLFQEE